MQGNTIEHIHTHLHTHTHTHACIKAQVHLLIETFVSKYMYTKVNKSQANACTCLGFQILNWHNCFISNGKAFLWTIIIITTASTNSLKLWYTSWQAFVKYWGVLKSTHLPAHTHINFSISSKLCFKISKFTVCVWRPMNTGTCAFVPVHIYIIIEKFPDRASNLSAVEFAMVVALAYVQLVKA